PADIWKDAILNNNAESIWISGSPHIQCCSDEKHLIQFETKLNQTIKNLPVIGICPYSIDNFTNESFSCVIPLMDHHSGTIIFDDKNTRIMRTG
ncbi:MAG TPA: hypothetical protein DHN33_03070, partial [Eubacteriaceae bacterium]|nr:hypothetical protein [Eubacteriaceae bacterium]